jgi:hypothetical protein
VSKIEKLTGQAQCMKCVTSWLVVSYSVSESPRLCSGREAERGTIFGEETRYGERMIFQGRSES